MKSVTFSKTVIGADGEILKEGKTYSLNDASADRWVKRNMATVAEAVEPEVKAEPAHKDAPDEEAKPAEVKRKGK